LLFSKEGHKALLHVAVPFDKTHCTRCMSRFYAFKCQDCVKIEERRRICIHANPAYRELPRLAQRARRDSRLTEPPSMAGIFFFYSTNRAFKIKLPARRRATARRENHCSGTTLKIFPQSGNYMDV